MIRRVFNKKNICLAAVPLAMTCVSVPAHVAFADSQQIILEVSHAVPYRTGNSPIVRVAIANPAIADVAIIDKYNVNIIGKESGSTTLMIWTADGMRQDFTVTVSSVDKGTAEAIKASMNLPDVEVEIVGTGDNKKILLTGFVENQIEMELAENVASLYVSGEWSEPEHFEVKDKPNLKYSKRTHKNIINNIQIRNPIQVNLTAIVMEIDNNDGDKIGFEYANPSTENKYINVADGASPKLGESGVFGGGMTWHKATGRWMGDVNGLINMMVTKQNGKILSRPNVTTMSGKEAGILIGGELPSPVLKDGQITYEWKPFGITFVIKPEVDTENKIFVDLYARVSDIDLTTSVTTSAGKMPAISSTEVITTVQLFDKQAMVIGGLMNKVDSKTVKKFPLLGDIPVLGELFKSRTNEKKNKELVIVLVPELVKKEDLGKMKVSNSLQEMIERSKQEMASRKEVDMNAPPQPTGTDRVKK